MLVKTSDYSHAIENTNVHYKMYKSKKNIVYASLVYCQQQCLED